MIKLHDYQENAKNFILQTKKEKIPIKRKINKVTVIENKTITVGKALFFPMGSLTAL